MSIRLEVLQQLFDAVCAHDKAAPKIYWHLIEGERKNPWDFWLFDEERLIAFFAAYLFEEDRVEITGMVHPNYRRHQIFNNFFAGFCRRQPRIEKFLFACSSAQNSKKCMKKLGAKLDYTECELIRPLTDSPIEKIASPNSAVVFRLTQPANNKSDFDGLVEIDHACFGTSKSQAAINLKQIIVNARLIYVLSLDDQIIGKVHVRPNGATVSLNDIAILPEFQKQGFGQYMLNNLFVQLRQDGFERVVVEVNKKNKAALSLYQSQGFVLQQSYLFYSSAL